MASETGELAIDRPAAVRPGEELEPERLANYLRTHLSLSDDAMVIEQFPRGFSNLTYLLRVGDRELVLRRPPFGVARGSAHDMGREHRILSALRPVYAKAPRTLAFCDDESVIGAPFYVMERVRGVVLRGDPRAGGALGAPLLRRLSERFVDELVDLHAVEWETLDLGSLGNPEGYVGRQVAGWTKRWAAAWTTEVSDVERVAAWLAAHQPAERGASLIHNDFKYDNLVLAPDDPSRIIAVLDWEMSTIGDPLMDLGTSLGYWVEPADSEELRSLGLGMTALEGNLTRTEVADRYAAQSGHDVSDIVFYYVFGLFKIAVIAQQIHVRFVRGFTHDPRFATLDRAVAALGRAAWGAVRTARIDGLGG